MAQLGLLGVQAQSL